MVANSTGIETSAKEAPAIMVPDPEEPAAENLPPKSMPIAIIGMSCRFPGGATDPSKLWDMCIGGRSAWSAIPESRFNHEAWYHPDKEHRGTVSPQAPVKSQENSNA
jgi:hypothetical protein